MTFYKRLLVATGEPFTKDHLFLLFTIIFTKDYYFYQRLLGSCCCCFIGGWTHSGLVDCTVRTCMMVVY